MTKTKYFDAFFVSYRTVQFPAISALDLMGRMYTSSPIEVLSRTAVKVGNEWVQLDNRAAINEHLRDATDSLPPILVLRGITQLINDFSFDFARDWSGVKIPARFKSGADPKSSAYVPSMLSHIMQEGMATLRELEEYYSLEDAFKMFDVLVVKSVNTALAHEAATKGKR
jgi:hypothetical protein